MVPRRAVLVLSDPYTLAECERAFYEIFAVFGPGFPLLVDRRGASPPDTAFAHGLTTFLEKHAAHLAGTRAAVIAVDDGNFGMARMISLISEVRVPGFTLRVFRDSQSADEWLTK